MGNFTSLATGLISTLSAVNSAVNTISRTNDTIHRFTGGEYRDMQAQQNLAAQQQAAQNSRVLEDSRLKAEQDSRLRSLEAERIEAARTRALRSTVARTRAAFGAQGITPTDGSAEAVLLGLFQEGDDEREARERRDQVRAQADAQSLARAQQRNLLEETELAERQRLQRQLYRF